MSARRLPVSALPLLAVGVTSLAVKPARADEPEPMVRFDPAAKPPPSTQTTLILLGSAGFGLSYGGALGASYLWESDPCASDLRIPVVGPWLKLGHTELCVDETNGCNNVLQVVGAVAAGLDGLLQAGSLTLLIEGIFASTRSASVNSTTGWQRTRFSSPLVTEVGELRFVPIPFVQSGSDLGLGIVGTF